MLRALLLAPPGAGKGTQGHELARIYGSPHLATGELLREHVASQTPIGRKAQEYMDRGELVPDELVIELILDRVDGDDPLTGFILDGFPRTLSQAEAAHAYAVEVGLTFHAVISLEVPTDELVRRLVDRGRSSGRTDDNESVIRNRLEVYRSNTAPLIEFYDGRGILHRIDGVGAVPEVTDRIRLAIEPLAPFE